MTSRFRQPDALVDMDAIAQLLDVDYGTVQKWRTRGLLPEPIEGVKSPVWWRSAIVAWAKETGRWEY